MKAENEIWKDIPEYEGLYQVSNLGRVKSYKTFRNGLILSTKNSKGWYLTLNLSGKGKPKKTVRIHRLVAELFIPNPFKLNVVNHIDLNKQNNNYNNLEWVTDSENSKHAAANNPKTMAGLNRYNKILKTRNIIQKTLTGEYVNSYINGTEAAKNTGVCQRNILQVANKTEFKKGHYRKQAGGFIWEFGGKNV